MATNDWDYLGIGATGNTGGSSYCRIGEESPFHLKSSAIRGPERYCLLTPIVSATLIPDRDESFMRVKLVWIERDFRGKELSKREEILCGESAKNPTRNHIARLIARHHPELESAGNKIFLGNAYEDGHRWYVMKATQLDSNRWLYAYVDPLDEGTVLQKDSQPDQRVT